MLFIRAFYVFLSIFRPLTPIGRCQDCWYEAAHDTSSDDYIEVVSLHAHCSQQVGLSYLKQGEAGATPLARQLLEQATTWQIMEPSIVAKPVSFYGVFLYFWDRNGIKKPGRYLKSFLEVVRFILTEYGPVGSHEDPAHDILYRFVACRDTRHVVR